MRDRLILFLSLTSPLAAFAAESPQPAATLLRLGETTPPVFGASGYRAPRGVFVTTASGTAADGAVTTARGSDEWTLDVFSVGRTLSEQESDYAIGDWLGELPRPAAEIDWGRTLDGLRQSREGQEGFIACFENENDPKRRILLTRGGTVKLNFVLKDGSSVEKVVSVAGTGGGAHPLKLYATRREENNLAAYIDLSDRYVSFFGNPEIVNPLRNPAHYEVTGAGQTNVTWGIDYNPAQSKFLTARYIMKNEQAGEYDCPEGTIVVVYYTTELKREVAATVAVQIVPPAVNTIDVTVGSELLPAGGGFDTKDLYPSVAAGVETVGTDPYSPYVEQRAGDVARPAGRLYAIAPTDRSTNDLGLDMPWKADVYWKRPDAMGTLWTFENDWYQISWPDDALKLVVSAEPDEPGLGWSLPSSYSASVCAYRSPLDMSVGSDDSGRIVCNRAGRFLVKLEMSGTNVCWYLPVESYLHNDTNVCAGIFSPTPWPVGKEVVPTVVEPASAEAAGRADASLPGYIFRSGSDGRNWNPLLYHDPSASATSVDVGSLMPAETDEETGETTADGTSAFASLQSAIYGVNECADKSKKGVVEVWWRTTYQGRGLPEPITYPGYAQVYRFAWAPAMADGVLPEIVLASEKGSYDTSGAMTAFAGRALVLASGDSRAAVVSSGDLVLRTGDSAAFSFQLLVPAEGTVGLGRLATVKAANGRMVAFDLTEVSAGDSSVTVTVRLPDGESREVSGACGAWLRVEAALPADFFGDEVNVGVGCGVAPLRTVSATGVALDDLSLDGTSAAGAPFTVFRFDFADSDLQEEAGSARGAIASIGEATLTGTGLGVREPGARRPVYGLFAEADGVTPALYCQNDSREIGFNPNEEHAFVKKEANGHVLYALRNDLNTTYLDVQAPPSVNVLNGPLADNALKAPAPNLVQSTNKYNDAVSFVMFNKGGKGAMWGFKVKTLSDDYPVFHKTITAGSRMVPPHPIGALPTYASAFSLARSLVDFADSEVVYVDRKNEMWARRDGKVSIAYCYPTQPGFYLPSIGELPAGTHIGWMNSEGSPTGLTTNQLTRLDTAPCWTWTVVWPTNGVPTMRIGQTLTKAANDLPEVFNAASMAVVYPMPTETNSNLGCKSTVVDLIDPTQARTSGVELPIRADFAREYGFTIGSSGTCTLRKGKYYFSGLPPSIADRFYVDANAAPENRMVLVGSYDTHESGGSLLRLNVLTDSERQALIAICKATGNELQVWINSVNNLAKEPVVVTHQDMATDATFITSERTLKTFEGDSMSAAKRNYKKWQGDSEGKALAEWSIALSEVDSAGAPKAQPFRIQIAKASDTAKIGETNVIYAVWHELSAGWNASARKLTVVGEYRWQSKASRPRIVYDKHDHYALVANGRGANFVTLVENDNPDPSEVAEGLPISMHVIRVLPELHSDTIAVQTDPLNKLSEKLTLSYRSPFGRTAKDFDFEWWSVRPETDGEVPEPKGVAPWAIRPGHAGRGLTSIQLGNQPTPDEYVNTYYTVRYRPREDTPAYRLLKVVHPEWAADDYWSAWSPEQLAEGWLQRVLNSVTPFAQRVEDFYNNPSDIAFTMLEQIGRPYQGDVALNNENLKEVGLLELYQTLFNRVESLMIASSQSDPDLGKQLLLAATRMGEFYTLLGAEAYSDAKNPLIQCADGETFPAGTFSFANQVQSLLDEELALLRGRTASTQFPRMNEAPCFNRLAWNFTKGLTEGEAAYVNNYGIRAREGVMDVNCAAAQYPQGHGDAYGHYLSALTTYYRLLRNPKFVWITSMMEMLMDQKLTNVDYQDEQKFADAAVKLAQTGLDAMDLTMRKAYRDEGRGAAACYFDSNTNQAFGVGEWATRTEMGAIYNWMAGNALLPTNDAPYAAFTDKGIKKIDRTTATQLNALCDLAETVETRLANYAAGMNPLGLDENAIPFDIDADAYRLTDTYRQSHFEQILERAEKALENCRKVLDYANVYGARLRQLQEEETDTLAEQAKTEQSYNNQLIAIYGTPFPGDIGVGGTYPQGYEGPDIYNYNCMDLDPFGLTEQQLATVCTTNFVTYKATNSGMAGQVRENTNSLVSIKYVVSEGGIRQKTAQMTGVRATEGSLQQKYREFLTACSAYNKAVASVGSKIKAMNKVATKVRVGLAQSYITTTLKYITKILDNTIKGSDYDAEEERWKALMIGINQIKKSVAATTGFTIAGTANGGDQMAQAKQKAMESMDLIREDEDFEVYQPHDGGHLNDLDGYDIADDFGYRNEIEILLETEDQKTMTARKKKIMLWWGVICDVIADGFSLYTTQRDLGESLVAAAGEVTSAAKEVQSAVTELSNAEAAYRAELYKGQLLLDERELWRKQVSNAATASRYADMFNRVQRNLALTKYSTAFDTAQKYVWELAKVYDYETGLLSHDAAGGASFLADIVATRSLGADGVSISSGTTDGGLYDAVNRMKANWDVLKGRLGINNADKPEKWFSLRYENFRVAPGAQGDGGWSNMLANCYVPDIRRNAAYRRYCQPMSSVNGASDSPVPGFVITFRTQISEGENFFGKPLMVGDSQFSPADYATKIESVGVYFEGYDRATDRTKAGCYLAAEPNVYLVPIGRDVMYSPVGTDDRQALAWNVVDQVMPLPYTIGTSELDSPTWVSTFSSLAGPGSAATIRRHSTMRMGYDFTSTRLVGRSAWNTEWMLVIPLSSLNGDLNTPRATVRDAFAAAVKDIKLGVRAYSRQGN